jgi:hypothetical protein
MYVLIAGAMAILVLVFILVSRVVFVADVTLSKEFAHVSTNYNTSSDYISAKVGMTQRWYIILES